MLITLGAIASGCASGAPAESRATVVVEGAPPVDVRVSLTAERTSQQARWIAAATAAVRQHLRMLGSVPAVAITIVDRPRAGGAGVAAGDAIAVAAPLWSSVRGMSVEVAVTRAVASEFWRREIPCAPDRDWFVSGLARYSSTVSLASQYDGARDSPSIGAYEQRYAGGFLPWVLQATVPAWGSSLSAYRADPRANPVAPRSAPDRDALEAKTALAAQTLSAWMGGPTWDAVLRSFVSDSRGRCASWPELTRAASGVTGLDLSWFFDQVFTTDRVFDYGVERLTSEPDGQPPRSYRTTLVIRRYGEAMFTGSASPPIEPFESGRGVEVALRFADGTARADYWDGRAVSRTFDYQSTSPAVSATVDPRQIILLDVDRANNSRTRVRQPAATVTRWSLMWGAWLEHLLLSYASLV